MKNVWNPWHGCKRISEGCRNCYVFDRDQSYGRAVDSIWVTKDFELPIKKDRVGEYKIPDGARLYTCMTSDFFLEEADQWRTAVWRIIAERSQVHFSIFTKRVERIRSCLPVDWNDGYDNVTLICSIENQEQCEKRLPVFRDIIAKHKMIACAPLLEEISIKQYLNPSSLLVYAERMERMPELVIISGFCLYGNSV